jgi:cysteinyl-tRNA synthetase
MTEYPPMTRRQFGRQGVTKALGLLLAGISGSLSAGWGDTPTQAHSAPGRGFPAAAPWVSFYGPASRMGDLNRVARTFRVINIDADPASVSHPDHGNFTRSQIARLKAGGRNRVLSYLNIGSCESFRTYWNTVPAGYVSARHFAIAPYGGYPDEEWMDLSSPDYRNLIVNYVAARLVAMGVDGFYLDNMELVEHGPHEADGPCSPACRQGGLDIIGQLREKYPDLLIVMQNATSDVTRLGKTEGKAVPSLLDGIAHEEVYSPVYDPMAEAQLIAWKQMHLRPGGRPFWIATEDYVGAGSNTAGARKVYARSRAQGFSPYTSDASAGQQRIFYWPF